MGSGGSHWKRKRGGSAALAFVLVLLLASLPASAQDEDPQPHQSRDSLPKSISSLGSDDSFKTDLFTGSFSYSYSLEVPPGTSGLEPELSVFYASHRTTGQASVLGSSWDLSQTYVQRDVNSTVDNTSDDGFTLVLGGTSYDLVFASSEDRYHTEVESHLFIRRLNTTGNDHGSYWIVKTRDGTSFHLGLSEQSEMSSSNGTFAWRWYVALVNDTHNNTIFYQYTESPNPGESSATYLDNVSYNNDRLRLVTLEYEESPRPDLLAAYDNGNLVNQSRRLMNVSVYFNDSLVRKYAFEYSNLSQTDSRSFLSSITVLGSDESTLPPTTFEYNSHSTNWTLNGTWDLPICIAQENSGFDYGVRLVDFNNDGFTDLLRARDSGNCVNPTDARAFLNTGSGWSNDTPAWHPPVCFVNTSLGRDSGARLVDVNGDGLVDVIRSMGTENNCDSPTVSDAYINNGSGWVADPTWNPPLCIVDTGGKDMGTRLSDVNGDGLVDLVRSYAKAGGQCSNPDYRQVYLNNGSGWSLDGTGWGNEIPYCFFMELSGSGYVDPGTRLVDVNGDGLPDIIWAGVGASCDQYPEHRGAFINTGEGWVNETETWGPPTCFVTYSDPEGLDKGARLLDLNGDGLIDIVRSVDSDNDCASPGEVRAYVNNGTGWTRNDSLWAPPLCFTTTHFGNPIDHATRIADLNGDGLPDLVRSVFDESATDCESPDTTTTYINNVNRTFLLEAINGSMGGVISVEYERSVILNNTGNDSFSDLGFNLWVVSSVTRHNGLTGEAAINSTTAYNYSGGAYDYGKQEFRGFSLVNETLPDGTVIAYRFHQDEPRAGRVFMTEVRNSGGSLYQAKESVWNSTENATSGGRFWVTELTEERTSSYDTSESARISAVRYSYDGSGNVLARDSLGDLSASGDERYERFEYVYNASAWIVDALSSYTLLEADNSTVTRQSNYSYDSRAHGSSPSKGDLTLQDDLLAGGVNPVTRWAYDGFGNLVNRTDPNGHSTLYSYGSVEVTSTFPDQEENALGHVTTYSYDVGLGQLLSSTDSNGFTTTYAYDSFGRLSKEVRPFDSDAYPTVAYEYDLDGVAPEKIKVSRREQNATNSTFDTFRFYDGFGSVVTEKREAEGSRHVRTDTFLDGNGRVEERSNPYFTSADEDYTSPNASVPSSTFAYDALDRVTTQTNPDGTQKTFAYDHWNTTATDENGNQVVRSMDAYGQVTDVYEPGGYRTTYEYDASGSLLSITDNEGNVFAFDYDSLGRRTGLNDPDLGIWNYSYDSAGNLIQQTDARGVVTSLAYDSLGRLARKNSSTRDFLFTFDSGLNATLSSLASSNLTVNYTYDSRLRRASETRSVAGVSATFTYSYDSMDRLTSQTVPGDSVNFTYSPQNTIDSIAGVLTDLAHNELDLPLYRKYGNALATNFTYDPENLRLIRIRTPNKQDLSYTYDDASNVLSINDSQNSRFLSLAYDTLNRLVTAQLNDSGSLAWLFSYTYSSIGNVLRVVGLQESLSYDYGSSPVHAPSSITNGTIDVSGLEVVYSDYPRKVFRFTITNIGLTNLTDVNWTLETGEASVTSSVPVTLTPTESVKVLAYHEYSSSGTYQVTARAENSSTQDTDTLTVDAVMDFSVGSLAVAYQAETERVFHFLVRNNLQENLTNVSWTLQTGDGNLSSSQEIALTAGKTMPVIAYHNYSSAGSYNVTASIRNATLADETTIEVTV